MTNLHNNVLKTVHSPYNVHILNIINAIDSLKVQHDLCEHTLKNSLENITLSLDFLDELKLQDFLKTSSAFYKIIDYVKQVIQVFYELCVCSSPNTSNPILNTLNALLLVIDAYLYKDENTLEDCIESLEQHLDINETENIQKYIEKILLEKIQNKQHSSLILNVITDVSSSIYGLIASLSFDSKWENIIKNIDLFRSFIKSSMKDHIVLI